MDRTPNLDTPPSRGTSSSGATRPNGNGAKRRQHLLIGLGTLAAIALGIGVYWFFFLRGYVFTDDARFGGHLVDLAPEINGRITEVQFHEGQAVRRGDDVFRLDATNATAALAQAEALLVSSKANLLSSQAKYDKARNGSRPEEIRAAEATAKRFATEAELARLSFERIEMLTAQGSASQDDLDRARTAYHSAQQNRENAAQNLALLQQGTRAEDVEAARADMEVAQSRVGEATAELEQARADLTHCAVKAPFDGWVVRRWLDPGAITPVSQPVVTLFDPATLRVDANIEEKYLHDVHLGDEAIITVDAYPRLALVGRVTEILRATNSQFSLIPSEGVSGTFIKVTQRVPLRIAVAAPADLPIGPGLSVEVKIRVGSSNAAHAGPSAHAGP